MTGKRIGYKRVSTYEQNPESQLVGIELDKVFIEIETGYSTLNRHQLKAMQEYVREDDIVFVECLDRLGRNGYDLDQIVEFLLKKGVQITFVRENIVLGKKNDIMSKLAYDMMKAFIHFYSQLTKDRQRRGIHEARARGKYSGRPRKLNSDQIKQIQEKMKTRESKSQIAREFGISRITLRKYLQENQVKEEQK